MKTLKIYYDGLPKGGMDEDIRKVLKKHEFYLYGSGYDLTAKVRDLAFEKIEMLPDTGRQNSTERVGGNNDK